MIGFNLFFVCTILLSGSNANPIHDLQSRKFGKDITWDEAVERGKEMDAKLNAATAVASLFTEFKDLEKWGWSSEVEKLESSTGFEFVEQKPYHYQLDKSLQIKWEHQHDVKVNGKIYDSTGGFFQNIYSPLDGMIIVENSRSPEFEYFQCPEAFGDDDGTGENLVKLKSWSDVTFLEWKHLVVDFGLTPNRLKWVLRSTITNEDTLSIMEEAVDENFGFDNWEKYASGVLFERGTDEFNALLGTAHGRGTAFMLVQHRSQLDKKRISKITVIGQQIDKKDKYPWMAGMLFEFENI